MESKLQKKRGILAGGSWILDEVKVVDSFPAEQSLANILDEYTSNGGSAYNILVDLCRLGAPFPLEAVGLLGEDVKGEQIIAHCRKEGIDVSQLRTTAEAPTSYTIVASAKDTGRRTFFHHRGANSFLGEEHFDFTATNANIFHLGYLLLLDRLDKVFPDGRTEASHVLEKAKDTGLMTSVDLVSEHSDRFAGIIPCSLPYVDLLFLNEYEASKLSGVDLMPSANSSGTEELCEQVFDTLFEMGVREWAVVHWPDGVRVAHRGGMRLYQPSVDLPEHFVSGANGAGDALAAGVLFGIHEGWDMKSCLELGVCAAASSLSHVTCSEGVKNYEDCLALGESFGYRTSLCSF